MSKTSKQSESFKHSQPKSIPKSSRTAQKIRNVGSAIFTLISLYIIISMIRNLGEITLLGMKRTPDQAVVHLLEALGGILFAQGLWLIEQWVKVRFPLLFEVLFQVFLVTALGMGSIFVFFQRWENLNTICHTFSSVLLAIFGYTLWELTSRRQMQSLPLSGTETEKKRAVEAALAKSKSMAYLSALALSSFASFIWEMIEFAVDAIIPSQNAQRFLELDGTPKVGRAALVDTMSDLNAHVVGAAIGLVLLFIWNRFGQNWPAEWQLKGRLID